MFRSTLTSLSLVALLAGCDGPELRSPACDEGKPVVASGHIELDTGLSKDDVSSVQVSLLSLSSAGSTALAEDQLEAPGSFPLSFTLCADTDGVEPGADLFVQAIARRAKVQAASVTAGALLERDALPTQALDLLLTTQGCQSCGPACDPACAFDGPR